MVEHPGVQARSAARYSPAKRHWRDASCLPDIDAGLASLAHSLPRWSITALAGLDRVGMPRIWVMRKWHKIDSEEKLETTTGFVAYPGDTIASENGKTWVIHTPPNGRKVASELFGRTRTSQIEGDYLISKDNGVRPLPAEFRETDLKDGHIWGFWKRDAFQCCALCMMIRRADDRNSPCRGKAKLREMENPIVK